MSETRIARFSRLVSKPGAGPSLAAAVREKLNSLPAAASAFAGARQIEGNRTVVKWVSLWPSADDLRAVDSDLTTPLGFEDYAELVEDWTLEYFEEIILERLSRE